MLNNSTYGEPKGPSVPQHYCNIGEQMPKSNIVLTLYLSLVLLASVCGNSLVILAILTAKELRVLITSTFILSLACSDLGYSLVAIPFQISMLLHNNFFCHGLPACFVYIIGDAVFNMASVICLTTISIDRFIAIAYPYHYHANWDRKKSRCIIILFWLFTVLWTLCGLWDWGTNSIKTLEIFTVTVSQGRCVNTNTLFYVSSYGIYVSGVLVMTICYVFILKVAIQHIKAIHSTTSTTMQSERKINSKTHRRNKEWKATKSMAVVYFSFLFCWFPLLIINVIISIDKMFFYKMLLENEDLFLFMYYTFIVILPALNFMINPVIYSFTNKSFRSGMKSIFRNIKAYQFNNNSIEPAETLHKFSTATSKHETNNNLSM